MVLYYFFTQSIQFNTCYSLIQMITVVGMANSFYHLNFRQNMGIIKILARRLILLKQTHKTLTFVL